MPANTIRVTVENPDELLNVGMYGALAIIRLQSSALEAGPFVNEATATITTGGRIYTLFDADGSISTWYRTRYENAGGTSVSEWSAPFQVADEGAGQLCSIYDAKQRLKIADSDTSDDEYLLETIAQVSADIQTLAGRRFARNPSSGTKAFLFDIASEDKIIWVKHGIAEMTQLEVASSTGGGYVVVPTTDWWLDPPEQDRGFGWPATMIVLGDVIVGSVASFYVGKRVVRATMAEGWTTVPHDIRGLAERMVVRSYKARQSGQSDIIGTSDMGARILRFMAPEERDRIDNVYKPAKI